jgi:cytochrome c556
MKRITLGLVCACIIGAGAAVAAGDPIKERQELMKGNGGAMKAVTAMVKGEKPYDAAVAASSMKSIAGSVDKFLTLFPKGSETGGDTVAKAEIWASKAEFDALGGKLKEAAGKAEIAAAGGLEGFKAAIGDVGKSCKACHEKFRAEKDKK